jgi:septal ring factor EnvC (AmiA/AmiB activator)
MRPDRRRTDPTPRTAGAVRARTFAVALALGWGLAPSSLPAQPVPDEPRARSLKAEQTEADLARLRADIDALKGALETGQRQESGVVADLAAAERAVSAHRAELAAIAGRSAAIQAELDRIAADQARVQAEVESQRSALAALLRLSYARSRQAPAKLLLDPERAPRLARALGYGRVLQRARLRRITGFASQLAQLATLADERIVQLAALADEQAQAQAQEAALAAAVAERERSLDELRRQLTDQRQQLAALGRDERGLVRLLGQLRDIFADLPRTLDGAQPFASLRGRLDWPLAGPVEVAGNGALTIAADDGTPVRAIAHGRVAFADWLKGYGLLLIVDHGEGYMSLYGRNEVLLKGEGAWVQAGDTIGRVGRSGGEPVPALHFELRERGRSVDPRPWLRRR